MKKIFFFAALAITSQSLIAQTIGGKITDTKKAPVVFASVSLVNSSDNKVIKADISDSLGSYSFKNIPRGAYRVEAAATGYRSNKSKALVTDSLHRSYLSIDISLEDDAKNLGDVTVTARKKLIEMFPDKMVMNIENSIVAIGNSAFDLLRKAPGVNIDAQENIKLKGQGVTIFIDDKPAFVSGEELLNYLKNLQADEISKIEIISNPGSRYPAQGTGGIINIKLKKNKRYGSNGTVGATLGYGKYPKLTGSGSFNYRNKNINIFSGASTGKYESYNQLVLNSTIGNGNNLVFQKRDNYWNPVTVYTNLRFGADYTLDSKSTIGFLARGTFSNQDATTTNSSLFTTANSQPQSLIESTKDDIDNNSNLVLNLNYKKDIDTKGSSFNIDADYGYYRGRSNDVNTNNFNNYTGSPRSPYIFRNITPVDVHIYSLKTDWVKYIDSSFKIEAGAKLSFVKNDNEIVADSVKSSLWKPDASRSNHFIYDENIYAGYFTLSKTIKRFSFQAGLRLEYTNSTGNSITLNRIDKRNYVNVFPSVFTNYKLDSNNTVSLNYSYRINRPGYQSLNPFINFVDPYTYFEGNPFLRPSYSHSIDIKHGFHDFLYTTIGYRYSTSVSNNVILQDTVTRISLSRNENVGNSKDLTFDISAGFPLLKWWNTDLSGGIAYSMEKSDYVGFTYDTKAWSGYFGCNNSFTISKTIKAELGTYINAPTRSGIATIAGSVNVSGGIQKQVWNEKGIFKLSLNNFIGPTQYNAYFRSDLLNIKWINQWEGKRISLSFNYKFGNTNVKASRSRRTASQEEGNRVNL
jgi:hypothetical protein